MINFLIALAAFSNFVLAFITYRKNSHSLSNISFAILAFTTGIWTILFVPYNNPFIFDSLFWIKAIYFALMIMIGALINFSYTFPYGEKPNKFILGLHTLLNMPIVFLLVFTNDFVKGVRIGNFGPETEVGTYYPYGAFVWGVFGLGIFAYQFIRKISKAKGRARFQLLYMFLGWMLFGIIAMILDAIVPLIFKTTAFFSLSAVFSLFFTGFTAYSIVRFRLLDIRIAIQETAAYVLAVLITAALFTLGAIAYWKNNNIPIRFEVIPTIVLISAIVTLFFNKIVFLSRKIVSKITNQPFYDFEKTVLNMSLDLTATLEINKLIDNLCDLFTNFLGVSDMAFILRNFSEKDDQLSVKDSYTLFLKKGFNQGLTVHDDGILVSFIERDPKMLILEEIALLVERSEHEAERYYLRELYTHMEYSNISLIQPLVANKELLGVVVLGGKKSGDSFTVQDINLLTTVISQFSNALENAISYTKIKRFNITLTEEVTKATYDLQSANSKLKELDKIKNDFVSVASHELRTPMTAIRSYAWMALHRSDVPLSAKLEKYIVRVLISTERLINLVNDMLNISRIESGKIEICPESVDLLELTKDIVDEVYYSKSQEKKIEFYILKKPTPKVLADPEKLREVLLNLVGNSLKFTPSGGKIVFDFFSDGLNVEVSVKDSGVGISKEDIGRLFQKFGRLDSSYVATASSGGTGLGLFISKRLIELMHGKIWASSEGLGKGTTVTISLPVATKERIEHISEYVVKAQGEAKKLEPAVI